MPISSELPPWLVPKRDPTPWLSSNFGPMLLQAMELPLKIQQGQLAAAHLDLQIKQAGLENELKGLQLQKFKEELPVLDAMKMATKGEPKAVLDYPVQSFTSPLVQKQYLDYLHEAAGTGYGISLKQRIIDQTKEVSDAMSVPGVPVLKPGPDGLFDPAELQTMRAKVADYKHQQKIEEIKAQHPDVTPRAVTITDDNGNPITMVQEGPSSWKPVDMTTTEVKTPDGTVLSIKTGAKGAASVSGNNPAVDSAVQKKIADSDRSLALIDETIGQIGPDTIGPMGNVKELAEIVGGIIKPGSMGTDVNAARQTMRMTIQNQLSSLKADSQINRTEAAQINAISDITGLKMSADVAKRKFEVLRDLTALQNILNHHQLNKFAPDNALKAISLEQVARAWKRGDITDAEVTRWNDLHQVVK